MKVRAVTGKNFGDEGKGLAVSSFAQKAAGSGKSCLVIRHNGGAQAGHTVENERGRFVFHQLSSGSLYGADTLWSETYLPDLIKLGDELSELEKSFGAEPAVYAYGSCRCTCILDIILNMAAESMRGSSRHGSCGMGINECMRRSESFPLYLSDICGMTADKLFSELERIRREYVPLRLEELGISLSGSGDYTELLDDRNILMNTAEIMCRNAENIRLMNNEAPLSYDEIIFEGAQGLLLDSEYVKFAPHLTNSRTGSYNPVNFCRRHLPGQSLEISYVTRTDVTRHGNGPLPYAGEFDAESRNITDRTNIPNDWQGTLRFAPHGTAEEFLEPVIQDMKNAEGTDFTASLMLTHIDETDGEVICSGGNIRAEVFLAQINERGIFDRIYRSASRFGAEI